VKVERASTMQHTRPSMRKMVTAGCPGGPGKRPVARSWPSRYLVHQTRPAMAYCDVTQTRMGVQGRFWDASGPTRRPKYTPFRGAALRRLAACACSQTISAFEPLILLHAPLTNFGWNPRTKCNRKFGRGIKSPHKNWKIGRGIP